MDRIDLFRKATAPSVPEAAEHGAPDRAGDRERADGNERGHLLQRPRPVGIMRMSGEHHPDSDQLELGLFPGEPWGGRSARVLTRGFKWLYLRPEPPRHEVYKDPEQLELWQVEVATLKEGVRRVSPGAPFLLEL